MAKHLSAATTEYTSLQRCFSTFMRMWSREPGLTADEPINLSLLRDDGQSIDVPEEVTRTLDESEFLLWAAAEGFDTSGYAFRLWSTHAVSNGEVKYIVKGTGGILFTANRNSPRDSAGRFLMPDRMEGYRKDADNRYRDERGRFVKVKPDKEPGDEPRPTKDASGRWRYKGQWISWRKARSLNGAITRRRQQREESEILDYYDEEEE